MLVAAEYHDRKTGACGFTLGKKRMKRERRKRRGVVTEKQLQVLTSKPIKEYHLGRLFLRYASSLAY